LEDAKIRYLCKLLIVTFLVCFTLSFSFHSNDAVFAQTDKITLKLQSANNAVGKAFEAVLDAEKAGANVSQLLVKLNTASELLSEAQNTYNSKNTANVVAILENANQIADQVNADAINLRNDSLIKSQSDIFFTLIFSIVGAIVFGISLILVWRKLKRDHVIKILDMNAGVVKNKP
jgi:hypothetical protein